MRKGYCRGSEERVRDLSCMSDLVLFRCTVDVTFLGTEFDNRDYCSRRRFKWLWPLRERYAEAFHAISSGDVIQGLRIHHLQGHPKTWRKNAFVRDTFCSVFSDLWTALWAAEKKEGDHVAGLEKRDKRLIFRAIKLALNNGTFKFSGVQDLRKRNKNGPLQHD